MAGESRGGITAIVLLAAAILAAPGPTEAAGRYGDVLLDLGTREALGLPQVLSALDAAPIVFFGERHTETEHRTLQARLLRALADRGAPLAVGLEVFGARDQDVLDRWVRGELPEDELAAVFSRNWNAAWADYREVFLAARDRSVPLLGLNVPKEITEQVAREGFASLSPEQLAEMPGVACELDDAYMAFIRQALGAHGAPSEGDRFRRFCEAQLVWDTTMAHRLVRFLRERPGTRVLVLAGGSHAWRHGIPRQVRDREPTLAARILLPEVPPGWTPSTVGPSEADYLWRLRQP